MEGQMDAPRRPRAKSQTVFNGMHLQRTAIRSESQLKEGGVQRYHASPDKPAAKAAEGGGGGGRGKKQRRWSMVDTTAAQVSPSKPKSAQVLGTSKSTRDIHIVKLPWLEPLVEPSQPSASLTMAISLPASASQLRPAARTPSSTRGKNVRRWSIDHATADDIAQRTSTLQAWTSLEAGGVKAKSGDYGEAVAMAHRGLEAGRTISNLTARNLSRANSRTPSRMPSSSGQGSVQPAVMRTSSLAYQLQLLEDDVIHEEAPSARALSPSRQSDFNLSRTVRRISDTAQLVSAGSRVHVQPSSGPRSIGDGGHEGGSAHSLELDSPMGEKSTGPQLFGRKSRLHTPEHDGMGTMVQPWSLQVEETTSTAESFTMVEPGPQGSRGSLDAEPLPRAVSRMRTAMSEIARGVSLSRGIHTLRDMADNTLISPEQLKAIKGLGAGSFAKVMLCDYVPRESTAKVSVAVKYLRPTPNMEVADLEAFQQEISLLRKLRNSHIVEFIGVGYTDARRKLHSLFLVQEYMNRGTLREMIKDQMQSSKRLYSYVDALRWSLQLAQGLTYLHDAKPMVIHRDLKLANILMSCPGKDVSEMQAKLADFGLVALIKRPTTSPASLPDQSSARSRHEADLKRECSATTKGMQAVWDNRTLSRACSKYATSTASQVYNLSGQTGTPLYMAPEVYNKLPYNEKVDVFSFAMVMFELFNRYMIIAAIAVQGKPHEVEQYLARVSQGYRPPFRDKVPQALQDLIARCWAQDPEHRPSMADVVRALQQMRRDGLAEEWDDLERNPPLCAGCTIS